MSLRQTILSSTAQNSHSFSNLLMDSPFKCHKKFKLVSNEAKDTITSDTSSCTLYHDNAIKMMEKEHKLQMTLLEEEQS